MEIAFYGATRTVTGSSYLFTVDGLRILIDCGLFQGSSELEEQNRGRLPYDPKYIDYIVLTHAHIDHSGLLPRVCKEGFQGKIIATKATADLCSIMLPDSGHIQEMEAEWLTRKRLRAGREPVEPLYTVADAQECLRFFWPVDYGEVINLSEVLTVRLVDAGHILGSASVVFEHTSSKGRRVLVFSGDIGRWGQAIIRDPTCIEEADVVLMETTYGDRSHGPRTDTLKLLAQVVTETLDAGGNLVIPAFSVGRTQEIIYSLNHLVENRLIPRIPVYIDSPLAVSATEVFRRHPECFDQETRALIESGDLPLEFPGLRLVRSVEESKQLNEITESCIIISASGMCTAGRIKHHLKHNLWRPSCTVLFVGYQAQGTLGRRILDGADRVTIFGEEIAVKARIRSISGFSAHADSDELMTWLRRFRRQPRQLFLVHGEENASNAFAERIRSELGLSPKIPFPHETVDVM